MEKCLVLINPGTYERELVLKIVNAFGGQKLIAKKWGEINADEELLRKLFPKLIDDEFFLTKFVPRMTKNDIVYGIFYGKDILRRIQTFVNKNGVINLDDYLKSTLRHMLRKPTLKSVYVPSSPEEAEKEIRILSEYLGITL